MKLILQTNKKLINLIEAKSLLIGEEQLVENGETKVKSTFHEKRLRRKKENLAKFDKDDDISTARKSKSSGKDSRRLNDDKNCSYLRTKKSKSSYRLSSIENDSHNENLIEMVKDMASFKWPEISKEQQQHHGQRQDVAEMVSSSRINKQNKFEGFYFIKLHMYIILQENNKAPNWTTIL